MQELNSEDIISWASTEYYLIREDKLISLPSKKWREINKGEKYCHIFQTPSTPPDFGLILKERKDLREVETLGLVPWDDEELVNVTNFDYLNIRDIKDFILQTKKFYNYYDKI